MYGGILFIAGIVLRQRIVRKISLGLMATGYVLSWIYTPWYYTPSSLVWNPTNFAAFVMFAIITTAAYLVSRNTQLVQSKEKDYLLPSLRLGAVAVVAYWLSTPIWLFPYNATAFFVCAAVTYIAWGLYCSLHYMRIAGISVAFIGLSLTLQHYIT